MRHTFKRLGYLAVATLALAGARPALAHHDTVIDWNERMQRVVSAQPGSNPLFEARWAAITQLAVFEAVNSITGDYEPYLGTIVAPAGASQGAAVASAAYTTLVYLRPSLWVANPALLETLTQEYNQSLAAFTVADGPASAADGVLVGQSAAVAMLALRAADGSAGAAGYPYTPGTGPGDFRPAAAPVLPGWGFVDPFGLNSGSQFPAPPPPALNSGRYVADFNEVKLVGRAGINPLRPLDRENAARFYAAITPVQIFNGAARHVMVQQRVTGFSRAARIFALLGMAIADASIACWDNKYRYNFWRPQAAIREGHTDGNNQTEADPTWTPLIGTPGHPSYGSGHGSLCGAARVVLERLLGEEFIIFLTTPSLPGLEFQYTAWSQITDDVSDARIYGGIHFRFDQEVGAQQGRKVGNYMLSHYLRSPFDEFGDED